MVSGLVARGGGASKVAGEGRKQLCRCAVCVPGAVARDRVSDGTPEHAPHRVCTEDQSEASSLFQKLTVPSREVKLISLVRLCLHFRGGLSGRCLERNFREMQFV